MNKVVDMGSESSSCHSSDEEEYDDKECNDNKQYPGQETQTSPKP